MIEFCGKELDLDYLIDEGGLENAIDVHSFGEVDVKFLIIDEDSSAVDRLESAILTKAERIVEDPTVRRDTKKGRIVLELLRQK